jgi:hypothetical protein
VRDAGEMMAVRSGMISSHTVTYEIAIRDEIADHFDNLTPIIWRGYLAKVLIKEKERYITTPERNSEKVTSV